MLKLLPDAAVIFQPYDPEDAALRIYKTRPSVSPEVSVGNVKVLFSVIVAVAIKQKASAGIV